MTYSSKSFFRPWRSHYKTGFYLQTQTHVYTHTHRHTHTQTALCICTGCERLSRQVLSIWLCPDKSPRHQHTCTHTYNTHTRTYIAPICLCPQISCHHSSLPHYTSPWSLTTKKKKNRKRKEAFRDEYPNFYYCFPLDWTKQASVNINRSFDQLSSGPDRSPIKMMDEPTHSLLFHMALLGDGFMLYISVCVPLSFLLELNSPPGTPFPPSHAHTDVGTVRLGRGRLKVF